MTAIGQPLPRREDARFLTGQGRYLDDIAFPGALVARFVRSPHAHALIRGIDTAAALAIRGVAMVATGADLARWTQPGRLAPAVEGVLPVINEAMPTAKVRFDGDLVACVVAEDHVTAADAAECVTVDYQPLPPVVSVASALAAGAPLVDPALGTNVVARQADAMGDVEGGFAAAYRIVEARFEQHRQTHAPMEPRGCCAIWDEGQQHLTMHIGNQAPHPYRTAIALRLGLQESQITVISPDVGGAFGQKIVLQREDLVCAALARRLKRPVRWREERGENLIASAHAREQVVVARAGVDADGRVLALAIEVTEDFGAYCFFPANYLTRMMVLSLTGPYRIGAYSYAMTIALTNKCGAAPMRAPMAMGSWVMDGTMDAIARALGLDPIAVRRRNMLTAADLPHSMPEGVAMQDVTPWLTFDQALDAFDVGAFRTRQAADRARGIYRGLGVCSVVESSTYGSAFYKRSGIPGSGFEPGWVKVAPSGSVEASCGLMGSGQGYETALAQAVASGLGVPADAVRMRLGNTDIAPYGMGSRGARGGTVGGSALFLAGQMVQRKVCAIGAALLDLNAGDDLRLHDGRLQRMLDGEWRDAGFSLADIARIAYFDPARLPPGMEPGLEALRAYDPPPMTYANATHLCEVIVDIETGLVTPVRYVLADDCGTMLNPIIVEGQQHGAVAMGLSGALREHVVYDAGGHNVTGSLMDYGIAAAGDLPPIEIVSHQSPNTRTPTGSKGMSEGGVMGAVGAVTLAVNDALAPFGVVAERQPLTPEAVLGLLRNRV